jgi:hypothetical protein
MINAIGKSGHVQSGAGVDVANASGTSSGPPELPEPSQAMTDSGDPAAAIAALLVKAGQEAKRGDRALQANEERMQSDAEDREIEAMRAKADDLRTQGLTEGLFTAASGGLTMGAGSTSGTRYEKLFSGSAKVTDGIGQVAGGGERGAVADDDTQAKIAEHTAARAKRAVDQAHDFQKDDGDLIKTAIEFYKEYSGAEAQARSAALHRS